MPTTVERNMTDTWSDRAAEDGKLLRRASQALPSLLFYVAASIFSQLATPAPLVAQEAPGSPCAGIISAVRIANALEQDILRAKRQKPNADRATRGNEIRAIASSYLSLVGDEAIASSNDHWDRLSGVQIYYRNFRVEEAISTLEPLMDGNGIVARIAWQRMIRMTHAALRDERSAHDLLDQYAQRFSPLPIDLHDRSRSLGDFAQQSLDQGDFDTVAKLILGEVSRFPVDAPYHAFTLPFRFKESIDRSKYKEQVHNIMQAKLAQMKRLRREWNEHPALAAEDPILRQQAPAWHWAWLEIPQGETFRAASLSRLDAIIADLEEWL